MEAAVFPPQNVYRYLTDLAAERTFRPYCVYVDWQSRRDLA